MDTTVVPTNSKHDGRTVMSAIDTHDRRASNSGHDRFFHFWPQKT